MMGQSSILDLYKKDIGKKLVFGVSILIFLIILMSFAVLVGPVNIPLPEILSVLTGQTKSGMAYHIIWNIRMPQILTAVIAGAGLAISGAVMQSVLRNPLGSPFTLGISHAAAFGAAFAIVILGTGTTHSSGDVVNINNPYITTISAFMFSMISTGVILALAKYKQASPETMILTGVAIGSVFTAGISAIQYFAEDTAIAAIIFWQFGDVGKTSWTEIGLITAVVVPLSLWFAYNSWNFNALNSGDDTAKSLGVDVDKLRIKGMVISSTVSALIVSFVGIIGFVGLVVPHIVRKLIGGNEMLLLPFSFFTGSLLLLISDTVARNIISPEVLPVGILTSFLGAPLFIYLVIKGREYW
ncbi:FecCD family ABC transporter permease [Methanosalsum natronophilum]|nr:iron ABC transporter permease [Methanosalsum natronophilum]MCS3923847.1 iron complex transport system permease protein [Methanosalsum natronophilum]